MRLWYALLPKPRIKRRPKAMLGKWLIYPVCIAGILLVASRPGIALRPVRPIERTSPFSIQLLLSVIKETKDEGWRGSELTLMTTLKLKKLGIETILMKTQYGHWFFYVNDFLVDCQPDYEAMNAKKMDIALLPIPPSHSYYRHSVEVEEEEREIVLNDLIAMRTSPVCLRCGEEISVKGVCGKCLIAEMERGEFKLPEIHHLAFQEIHSQLNGLKDNTRP